MPLARVNKVGARILTGILKVCMSYVFLRLLLCPSDKTVSCCGLEIAHNLSLMILINTSISYVIFISTDLG